jgi:hypothetical protein
MWGCPFWLNTLPTADQWCLYIHVGSINISMCSAESEFTKDLRTSFPRWRPAKAILTIRTWAVWERSREVAIFLCVFFATIWIPESIIMGFSESMLECEHAKYYLPPTANSVHHYRCCSTSRVDARWLLATSTESVVQSLFHSDRYIWGW